MQAILIKKNKRNQVTAYCYSILQRFISAVEKNTVRANENQK